MSSRAWGAIVTAPLQPAPPRPAARLPCPWLCLSPRRPQSNAPDKGLVGFMNDKLGTQTGTEEALDVDLFGESIGRLDFDLYR